MQVGILFNETHESLARALRALLPDADIISTALDRTGEDDASRLEIFTALRLCDHVISQDAGPEYGMFSNRALAAAAFRLHRLPALQFSGFHPDTVSLRLDGVPVQGPTGFYHSRITAAAFLTGLPADEAAALFTALVFARLGYFDTVTSETAALQERYLAFGIDISDLLPRWLHSGCFMHAPDHPKMRVMLDVARMACALMGVAPQTPSALPPDPLALLPQTPYFADIAQRHGNTPEGAFRGTLPAGPLSPLDFVLGSYDAFRRVPRACLRAMAGVQEAIAALQLPAPRRPARVLMPGAVGLLTWHGTIVRLERTSNLLVHEPFWPDGDDSVDFTLTPEAQADGTITASVLPGLEILPGAFAGTMALRRNGLALTADPSRLALPFSAGAVGPWESFVPLTARETAALRTIASRPWSCNGGPAIHPAAIYAGEDFTLTFGGEGAGHAADLRLQRPEPAGSNGDSFTLRSKGGHGQPLLLTLKAAGPALGAPNAFDNQHHRIPLLPAPRGTLPATASSLAAFRSTPVTSWLLDEGEDLLHPPLTVSVDDAEWLAGQATLQCGSANRKATLRRMPASVLLAPGFGGMLFNAKGILAHAPHVTPLVLPPGIARVHNILAADPSLLTDGEVLDGPVLVTPGSMLKPAGNGYSGSETEAGSGDLQDRERAGPENADYGGSGDRESDTTGRNDPGAFLLGTILPLLLSAEALPRGTRLLLQDMRHASTLSAFGLESFPRASPATPVCQLRDALWLDPEGFAAMPAGLLRTMRARIAARHARATDAPARILLQPERVMAPNPKMAKFLAGRGFVTVVPETQTPAGLRDLFLHASLIVAPSCSALAYLMLCAEGTAVLELSPDTDFQPRAWLLAEKLGLVHGVLPCPARDGALHVSFGRLRSLLRMLRLAADPLEV